MVARSRAFAAWRATKADERSRVHCVNKRDDRPVMPVEAEEALLALARSAHLTGRGITRLARIARTIADMAESEHILPGHIREAAAYRGNRA